MLSTLRTGSLHKIYEIHIYLLSSNVKRRPESVYNSRKGKGGGKAGCVHVLVAALVRIQDMMDAE